MATCDNYSDSPEGENEVKTKLNVWNKEGDVKGTRHPKNESSVIIH